MGYSHYFYRVEIVPSFVVVGDTHLTKSLLLLEISSFQEYSTRSTAKERLNEQMVTYASSVEPSEVTSVSLVVVRVEDLLPPSLIENLRHPTMALHTLFHIHLLERQMLSWLLCMDKVA